jgi:hypothetical protein
MTTKPQHPDSSGYRSEDEIDEVFGSANPNPERTGCPGVEVLTALARRERPIGDPGYEHIVHCSPCYRAFRALQQSPRVDTRGRVRHRWAVAAVGLAVAAAGVWFVMSLLRPRVAPEHVARPVAEPSVPKQLDLRTYSVTSSDVQGTKERVIDLPRGRLALTILLPAGSEAGSYEVQVLDSASRSRLSALGAAEIRNFVTTLRTSIDTEPLALGSYQLAVRRDGEDWQMYPFEIIR